MSKPPPQFAVGHRVRERFLFGKQRRETGVVIERYELENQYRHVVKFEDGREEVFFERELLSMPTD